MRLLLDTHVVLWWLGDDERLQPDILDAISDRSNRVIVSVGRPWWRLWLTPPPLVST